MIFLLLLLLEIRKNEPEPFVNAKPLFTEATPQISVFQNFWAKILLLYMCEIPPLGEVALINEPPPLIATLPI